MVFATKKDAVNWAKHHLEPTKYGNYYDPIEKTETRPVKIKDGAWKFEGRDDEWLDKIEAMTGEESETAEVNRDANDNTRKR